MVSFGRRRVLPPHAMAAGARACVCVCTYKGTLVEGSGTLVPGDFLQGQLLLLTLDNAVSTIITTAAITSIMYACFFLRFGFGSDSVR